MILMDISGLNSAPGVDQDSLSSTFLFLFLKRSVKSINMYINMMQGNTEHSKLLILKL